MDTKQGVERGLARRMASGALGVLMALVLCAGLLAGWPVQVKAAEYGSGVTSLKDAIDGLSAGGGTVTVTVFTADATTYTSVGAGPIDLGGKAVTLDLDGNDLTLSGEVEITDSMGDGRLQVTNGTLTVENQLTVNGAVLAKGTGGTIDVDNQTDGHGLLVHNYGEVTVDSAATSSTINVYYAVRVAAGEVTIAGDVSSNAGGIFVDANLGATSVSVGGSVTAARSGVEVYDNGEVTVGGNVSGGTWGANINAMGAVRVGGTLTGGSGGFIGFYDGVDDLVYAPADCVAGGGTFAGNVLYDETCPLAVADMAAKGTNWAGYTVVVKAQLYGWTDQLHTAVAGTPDGGTITRMGAGPDATVYTSTGAGALDLAGKALTLDLAGGDLTLSGLVDIEDSASGGSLTVAYGTLTVANTLTVTGTTLTMGAAGAIDVDNQTGTGDGLAVWNYGSATVRSAATNSTTALEYAVLAYYSAARVTGDVHSDTDGMYAEGLIGAITVGGSVTATEIGVISTDSTIAVAGNVSGGTWGVQVHKGGTVTVGGTLTGGSAGYIEFYDAALSKGIAFAPADGVAGTGAFANYRMLYDATSPAAVADMAANGTNWTDYAVAVGRFGGTTAGPGVGVPGVGVPGGPGDVPGGDGAQSGLWAALALASVGMLGVLGAVRSRKSSR